jgi:hypothetical protein
MGFGRLRSPNPNFFLILLEGSENQGCHAGLQIHNIGSKMKEEVQINIFMEKP